MTMKHKNLDQNYINIGTSTHEVPPNTQAGYSIRNKDLPI